jgi:hypothetical protein
MGNGVNLLVVNWLSSIDWLGMEDDGGRERRQERDLWI